MSDALKQAIERGDVCSGCHFPFGEDHTVERCAEGQVARGLPDPRTTTRLMCKACGRVTSFSMKPLRCLSCAKRESHH